MRRGDLLVVPDARVGQQRVAIDPRSLELATEIRVEDGLPLRTVPNFYGGIRPLERVDGPRLVVRILRALADHVPAAAGSYPFPPG
jgi:hypothetical protein